MGGSLLTITRFLFLGGGAYASGPTLPVTITLPEVDDGLAPAFASDATPGTVVLNASGATIVSADVALLDVEERPVDIVSTSLALRGEAADLWMDVPADVADGVYVQQVSVRVLLASGHEHVVRAERFFEVESGVLHPLTRREYSTRVLPTTVGIDRSGALVVRYAGTSVPAGGVALAVDRAPSRFDVQVHSGHDPSLMGIVRASEAGEE